MEKQTEEILTRLMYRLYYLPVDDNVFDEQNYPDKKPVDPENIKWDNHLQTFLALKWAIEHPEYDYKKLERVKYSPPEINYFFKKEFEWYEAFLKKNGKI